MNPPQVYMCSPSWTLLPPPSSLPIPSLWVVPVHQPQASTIVHRTWTVDLFHIWYYTYFNAILPHHPTLSLSHRVQKTKVCVFFFFFLLSPQFIVDWEALSGVCSPISDSKILTWGVSAVSASWTFSHMSGTWRGLSITWDILWISLEGSTSILLTFHWPEPHHLMLT